MEAEITRLFQTNRGAVIVTELTKSKRFRMAHVTMKGEYIVEYTDDEPSHEEIEEFAEEYGS